MQKRMLKCIRSTNPWRFQPHARCLKAEQAWWCVQSKHAPLISSFLFFLNKKNPPISLPNFKKYRWARHSLEINIAQRSRTCEAKRGNAGTPLAKNLPSTRECETRKSIVNVNHQVSSRSLLLLLGRDFIAMNRCREWWCSARTIDLSPRPSGQD